MQGEVSDVYTYDKLLRNFRVQVVQLIRPVFNYYPYFQDSAYSRVVNALRHEYGVFHLTINSARNGYKANAELEEFLLTEPKVELVLDAIELSFRLVNGRVRQSNKSEADQIISNLNARFKQHGIGYAFEDGYVVRVDSEYVHDQAVKPALRLISQAYLAGAQQEFLKAHEHYRQGEAKAALSECRKAFESTMKSICDKRGWTYDPGKSTAQPLIKACFENGLIPPFWESEFSHLKSLLETSVPTGVNKLAAHGVGATPTEVPFHIVSYILHMTASTIVFLAEVDAALP